MDHSHLAREDFLQVAEVEVFPQLDLKRTYTRKEAKEELPLLFHLLVRHHGPCHLLKLKGHLSLTVKQSAMIPHHVTHAWN